MSDNEYINKREVLHVVEKELCKILHQLKPDPLSTNYATTDDWACRRNSDHNFRKLCDYAFSMLYDEVSRLPIKRFAESRWISVEDALPPHGKNVLVLAEYENGNSFQFVGGYFEKHKEEQHCDDSDYFDYCEHTDTNYVPEGWYENQYHWDDYSTISAYENILAWMPLPEPPNEQIERDHK